MSAYVKGKGLGQEEARVHRIRITLTSKNVKNLEKGEKALEYSLLCSTTVYALIAGHWLCVQYHSTFDGPPYRRL